MTSHATFLLSNYFGGFQFSKSLIFIKVLWFCVLASEGIRSCKVICEYIVLFLIEKCVGSSILVEANLFLAIKLQPNLIILSILQFA